MLVASMSNTLASTGGFCVGSNEVVDHQRLSGAGYCYSASAPPFMMRAASFALRCMTEDPELVADLRDKIDFTWNRAAEIHGLRVVSDVRSPLIYLTLDVPDDIEFGDEAGEGDDDDDYVQAEVGVDDEWRGMIQGVVDMEQADVSRRGGAGEVREQLQNAADVLEAWEGDFPAAAEIAEEVLAAKKDFRVKNVRRRRRGGVDVKRNRLFVCVYMRCLYVVYTVAGGRGGGYVSTDTELDEEEYYSPPCLDSHRSTCCCLWQYPEGTFVHCRVCSGSNTCLPPPPLPPPSLSLIRSSSPTRSLSSKRSSHGPSCPAVGRGRRGGVGGALVWWRCLNCTRRRCCGKSQSR